LITEQSDITIPSRLSPIIQRIGTWAVTEYGLECIPEDYPIEANRLWESDWITHMGRKDWIVFQDFSSALDAAKRIHFAAKPSSSKWSMKRFQIMKRDGFRCKLCGASASDDVSLEVDHIVAKSKGGSDSDSNLWTLCLQCNRGKSNLDL
jgi:HNH endonuclease